jgi:hypothetical protein
MKSKKCFFTLNSALASKKRNNAARKAAGPHNWFSDQLEPFATSFFPNALPKFGRFAFKVPRCLEAWQNVQNLHEKKEKQQKKQRK